MVPQMYDQAEDEALILHCDDEAPKRLRPPPAPVAGDPRSLVDATSSPYGTWQQVAKTAALLSVLLLVAVIAVGTLAAPRPAAAAPASVGQSKVRPAGLYGTTECAACSCDCSWAAASGACDSLDGSCCSECCCGATAQGAQGAYGASAQAQPRPSYGGYGGYGNSFDCQAALNHWKREWSSEKQSWCCKHEGLGCSGFLSLMSHWWAHNWQLVDMVVFLASILALLIYLKRKGFFKRCAELCAPSQPMEEWMIDQERRMNRAMGACNAPDQCCCGRT